MPEWLAPLHLPNRHRGHQRGEVKVDGEWGDCRNLKQIETDGDLSPEIIQAREALKNAIIAFAQS